jgi:hypothetical protein
MEEGCEWVFFLDADTVIMNSSIFIESFLPDMYHMLITEQKGTWNAGAWIIRSSDWSLPFWMRGWKSGDNDALKNDLASHPCGV